MFLGQIPRHSPRVAIGQKHMQPFLASFPCSLVLNVFFICCKAHTTFTVISIIQLCLHSGCLLLWWLHFTPSIKGITGCLLGFSFHTRFHLPSVYHCLPRLLFCFAYFFLCFRAFSFSFSAAFLALSSAFCLHSSSLSLCFSTLSFFFCSFSSSSFCFLCLSSFHPELPVLQHLSTHKPVVELSWVQKE